MVGPLASNMSKLVDDEHAYYHVLRVVMLSFLKGMSPTLAIEMARRAVPEHVRPDFQEVEQACRARDDAPATEGAGTPAAATAKQTRRGLNPWRKHSNIIIIKKKKGHGGHHGGAWKVAYADFVTAMMALFIVLWLMNASKQVQEAVGGYFKDPRGTAKVVGTNRERRRHFIVALKKEDMYKLKDQLLQSIHHLDPQDKLKNQIEITVTAEGLRIELMESAKGTFFELGSATPTPALRDLLGRAVA